MRVISGKYRSRQLRSLPGLDVRPTSDRLRETLFNVLCSGNPAALENAVCLDLFAGTGAVGIEALSRGAGRVCFVENSHAAVETIRANLRNLAISEGFSILQDKLPHALRILAEEGITAHIVFLDPPYRMSEAYTNTLELLSTSSLLTPDSTVVAEHEKLFDPGEEFGGLRRFRRLDQGSASLSFYRKT